MSVVGVGLVDLHLQRRLRMARIDAHNGNTSTPERKRQPIGQLTCLKADPHRVRRALAHRRRQRARLGGAGASPDDLAFVIDDADRGELLGNIKADIVLFDLGGHGALLNGLTREHTPDAG